jgi:hypothetical protein
VQALRLHHEVAGMMKSEQELREKLKGLLAMDADKISPTWLAASGVSIDSLPVSLTQSDIERMKRQGYLGAGWAR